MECPCCFEELSSSFAALACSHRFHITCLVNWFATQSAQELPQNCPCCRAEAGPTERLPEEPEEGEEDDGSEDGSDYDEEEELMLTRSELDTILRSQGGSGVLDGLWFAFFNPEGDEELRADPAHRLPFVGSELSRMAVYQGGREISDERWEELVETYGEDEEEPEEDDDRAERIQQAFGPIDADSPPLPASLRISWRRFPDGHWERIVLNPEEEESASWGVGSSEPPPEDLVEQTSAVALRVQTLWRGFQARRAAAELKKQQEVRAAAAKIQAIWRGSQQREHYTAFLALRALRLSH
jgi:hypothetical protein